MWKPNHCSMQKPPQMVSLPALDLTVVWDGRSAPVYNTWQAELTHHPASGDLPCWSILGLFVQNNIAAALFTVSSDHCPSQQLVFPLRLTVFTYLHPCLALFCPCSGMIIVANIHHILLPCYLFIIYFKFLVGRGRFCFYSCISLLYFRLMSFP